MTVAPLDAADVESTTVEPVEAASEGIVEPTRAVAPSPQIVAAEPSTAWARMVVVVAAAIVAVAVGFGVYVVLGPS